MNSLARGKNLGLVVADSAALYSAWPGTGQARHRQEKEFC
jgi:hypothetical protein